MSVNKPNTTGTRDNPHVKLVAEPLGRDRRNTDEEGKRITVYYYVVIEALETFDLGRGFSIENPRVILERKWGRNRWTVDRPSSLTTWIKRTDGKGLTDAQRKTLFEWAKPFAEEIMTDANRGVARANAAIAFKNRGQKEARDIIAKNNVIANAIIASAW